MHDGSEGFCLLAGRSAIVFSKIIWQEEQFIRQTTPMKNNNTPLLPQDVLLEILSFIPYKLIIHQVKQVNHYFNELTNSKEFWKRMFRLQPLEWDMKNGNENFDLQYEFTRKFEPERLKLLLRYSCPYYSDDDDDNDNDSEDEEEDSDGDTDTYEPSNMDKIITLVEPFVTEICLDDDRVPNVSHIIREWPKCLKFPKLVCLKPRIFPNTMKSVFGNDLSRFKHAELSGSNSSGFDHMKFGNLESLTLRYCNHGSYELVRDSVATLKIISLYKFTPEILQVVSHTITNLSITLDEKEVFKPFVCSNLKHLTLTAFPDQIGTFFSVRHPLLTTASITSIGFISHKKKLIQHPSIRRFKFVGLDREGYFLDILSNNVQHISLSYALEEVRQFTNLVSLNFDNYTSSDLTDTLQNNQNTLSTLRLYTGTNTQMMQLYPLLNNIVTLQVSFMTMEVFQKLKSSTLRYLHVDRMDLSFAQFTKLMHSDTNLSTVSVGGFIEVFDLLDDTPVYIIAPLDQLHVPDIVMQKEVKPYLRWLLYAISTINVRRPHNNYYSKINDMMKDFPKRYKMKDVVTRLKDLLTEIFTNSYIHVDDLETVKNEMIYIIESLHFKVPHPIMKPLYDHLTTRDFVQITE